jgi:hypothetical protein
MAGSDSKKDDSDGSDESSEEKKNKLKIKAHDLEVKIESTESLEDMMEMGSEEMRGIMKQSMRGELEVMEEEDAHFIIGGGH